MYSKDKKIVSKNTMDLTSYMEGTDLYNSKLYYMIPKLPYIGEYKVDLSEYRIDLISKDIYDTEDLAEYILIYNGLAIEDLKKGVILKFPLVDDLRKLVSDIRTITNPNKYLKELSLRR